LEKLTMGFAIELDGTRHEVEIVALRPHLKLRVDGRECVVALADGGGDGRGMFEIDGEPAPFARAHAGARQYLRLGGRTFEAALLDPREAARDAAGGRDHVRAPMPGTVVHVHKQAGEAVARGEALLTIESMKLLTTLTAPRDGALAAILRGVGETFDKDEIVAELAPLGEA
jgi:biotin carboxyl carrier protein